MNRREFMNRLEQLLQGLAEEERKDALQYYEDYFEDAGPGSEQDVIRKLGSPEDVAKSIWDDAQQAQWSENETGYQYSSESVEYGNTGGSSNEYSSNNAEGYNYNDNYGNAYSDTNFNGQNYGNPADEHQNQKKKERNLIILIILIVTAPITIPAVFSVAGTILSFILSLVGCIIGFPIAAVALFIGAVALFGVGLTGFGLLCMGIGFGFLCAEFLLIPLLIWLCNTAVPSIYRWIRDGIRKLTAKGGNVL